MIELTGRATETEAWKAFFSKDDLVGIKVSPVGYPAVFSHHETVAAIVRPTPRTRPTSPGTFAPPISASASPTAPRSTAPRVTIA